MKILFDVNTPAPLARYLRGHEVERSDLLEWHRLANGRLLAAAEEAGFEVIVTCDQNWRFQQNLQNRKTAIVILSTNNWRLVRLTAARIATAIDFAQTGQVLTIDVANLSAASARRERR